jgi:hypothetical protein
MVKKTVTQLAIVALSASGLAFAVGAPGAAAPPCNPNVNGVGQSGQPDKGNDDHPLSCPATVDPGVTPTPGPGAGPAAAGTSTVGTSAAPASAVAGQPRLAG